jgi:hypothetical protein
MLLEATAELSELVVIEPESGKAELLAVAVVDIQTRNLVEMVEQVMQVAVLVVALRELLLVLAVLVFSLAVLETLLVVAVAVADT